MNSKYSGEIIASLRRAVYSTRSLSNVPPLIKKIIKERLWEEFYDEIVNGVIRAKTFEEFVTRKPPDGLGTTIRLLKNFCRDDIEVLNLIDTVTQRKPGKTWDSRTQERSENNVDNVNSIKRPDGNNETYALRKLRKDAPDIHKQVLDGKLSPHAGMVEAGFRKRYIQIPEDAEKAGKIIIKHFTKEEVEFWLSLFYS